MVNQTRKLFFLIALPRSGNTLFASIMNQNPNIACTGNSITLEIMKNLFLLKKTEVFQNFPDHKSLDNILNNVYNLYYKDWPQKIIIDRGPVMINGNPGNFELMKKHFKGSFKCIVLLRDLMEVLASYMKWYKENPDSFINKFGNTDEEKLFALMKEDGAIVKEIKSIQNARKYPKACHFIKYNDLVKNTENEIKKVYNFLEEPYYPHYFNNLKQLNVNGISYNDEVMGKNMHTIRTVIKKNINNYVVPKIIKQKYETIKF